MVGGMGQILAIDNMYVLILARTTRVPATQTFVREDVVQVCPEIFF